MLSIDRIGCGSPAERVDWHYVLFFVLLPIYHNVGNIAQNLNYNEMKKLVLFLSVLFLSVGIFAQEKEEIPTSKSTTVEFLNSQGSFIIKEFYDLPKVKGVECQVLIATDVVNGSKLGCLRLTTHYSSSYSSDSYIGTLDYDELDACVKSLQYIKDTLIPSTPLVYTEVEYKTKDGVELGAFFSKNKWKAYVYTKNYTSRSAEFLDVTNIDAFISVMNQAKNLIAEKMAK